MRDLRPVDLSPCGSLLHHHIRLSLVRFRSRSGPGPGASPGEAQAVDHHAQKVGRHKSGSIIDHFH